MSTIESQSGPVDRLRRTRGTDINLPDISERLETPGLVVAPPVSEGARVADSLLAAFSSLGGASAAIVRQQAIDAAAQAERDRVSTEHARELADADRGLATLHAGGDLPSIVARVDAGELVPEDGESARDFAIRIAQSGTDGQSLAYTNRRTELIADNIASALQRRADRVKIQAQTENAAITVQSIDGATDGTDFDRVVASIRTFNPNISEVAATAEVGQRWLDSAVALAATDPAKATAALTAARARLGDRMQTEQALAQAKYDAAIRGQASIAQKAERDGFFRLANGGASLDVLNDYATKAASIDEAQRAELLSFVDTRRAGMLADAQSRNADTLRRDIVLGRFDDGAGLFTAPSIDGAVNEVFRRIELPPTDPAFIRPALASEIISTLRTGDAAAQRERVAKLNDEARTALNAVQRDVYLQRASPVVLADSIVARMDLADSDPMHIPAGTGRHLLDTLRTTLDTGVRENRILADFQTVAKGTAAVAPALPSDDKPMTSAMVKTGVLGGTLDENGQPVVTGIRDPLTTARLASEFRRVPNDVGNLIDAGLGGGDAAQFVDAAATYAALLVQSPELAQSINLGDTAKLRARYIATRLDREGRSGLTDETLLTDPEYLRKSVAGIAADALRLTPKLAEYQVGQVHGIVYNVQAQATGATQTIREGAAKDITDAVYGLADARSAGITRRTLLSFLNDSGVAIDAIPANVQNAYLDALNEEYRFARAVSPSESYAITSAKKWAAQRVLAENPPMEWAGSVYFGTKGQPVVSSQVLFRDIMESLGGGTLTEPGPGVLQSVAAPLLSLGTVSTATDAQRNAASVAAHLLSSTVPEWHAPSGGFVFRNKGTGELYTLDGGGKPLVLNPYAPKEKTDSQRVIESIDARRAARGIR